ncbi:MAG: DNA recombination protein RmuC [Anaerovoracaceae bacterium]|nr:DNA recombination protein RmuC [Clostridiales bacterium]
MPEAILILTFFAILAIIIFQAFQLVQSKKEQRENRKEIVSFMQEKLTGVSMEQEQKLDNIRNTLEDKLNRMQDDQNKSLTEIRTTVDEKLQKTLEERIAKSFSLVQESLAKVSEGLGEMSTLATGVGDLQKVLSNVKTRGILGEIQLKAILEQILSKEQYEENVAVIPDKKERVEFAIKLPGNDRGPMYLPIDAKFPQEPYLRLIKAYEDQDQIAVDISAKELERAVKAGAKDIRDKYIEPPYTTDFGVMFLPVEGLYAEVVRRGLIEVLQRDYKVTIAGPTTFAALLNSLQMGFRTLAIEKRSSEIITLLSAVKTEFDKFQDVLLKTRDKLNEANQELDKLVGVRTRKIQTKLRDIDKLEDVSAEETLGLTEPEEYVEGYEEI